MTDIMVILRMAHANRRLGVAAMNRQMLIGIAVVGLSFL
jgi:hypothetical protein